MTSGAASDTRVVNAIARRLVKITNSPATPTEIMDVLWLSTYLPISDVPPQPPPPHHGQSQNVPRTGAPHDPVGADSAQSGDRRTASGDIAGKVADRHAGKQSTVLPNLVTPGRAKPVRQPVGTGLAEPVRATSGLTPSGRPTLRDPLGVGRALRSLQIRQPSAQFPELDEVATAERRVQLDWWEPVLRPRRVRWPDVAVVIECGPTTSPIWTATIRRLLMVFERLGAFRELRTWRLLRPAGGTGGDGDNSSPRVAPYGANGVAGSRPATTITDPTGRRLVLVVTDGASPHWRGPYLKQLHHWAKTNPVAVISLVPLRLWPAAVLRTVPGEVMADHPLQPNMLWRHRTAGDSSGSQVPEPVVPVADLNNRRLEWLAAALTTRSRWTDTALVAPGTADLAEQESLAAQPAYRTVQRFRARAQPRAFGLLSYLSATPLLQPLVDRVCQTVVPSARNEDLQEIFLSGLVETAMPDEPHPADAMALRFQRWELRREMAVRLHPEVDATIRWDLRAHAQDALNWEPDLAQALLDQPDDPVLLRWSAAGANYLPAAWWPVPPDEPGKFEIGIAGQLDQGRRPHLAVVGMAAPRRAVEITQLAQRLATADALRSDQVRTVSAADLAAAEADSAVRARIAELFADAVGAVAVDVPPWLCDHRHPGARFAVATLVEAMRQPRPGQLVVLSGKLGHVNALRRAHPELVDLVPDERVRHTTAEQFDDAYLIVHGLLKSDGLTMPAETAAAVWTMLATRYRQATEDTQAAEGTADFDGHEQAQALADQIVVNWRERTGGDPRQPVTTNDMLDTGSVDRPTGVMR